MSPKKATSAWSQVGKIGATIFALIAALYGVWQWSGDFHEKRIAELERQVETCSDSVLVLQERNNALLEPNSEVERELEACQDSLSRLAKRVRDLSRFHSNEPEVERQINYWQDSAFVLAEDRRIRRWVDSALMDQSSLVWSQFSADTLNTYDILQHLTEETLTVDDILAKLQPKGWVDGASSTEPHSVTPCVLATDTLGVDDFEIASHGGLVKFIVARSGSGEIVRDGSRVWATYYNAMDSISYGGTSGAPFMLGISFFYDVAGKRYCITFSDVTGLGRTHVLATITEFE